MRPFLKRVGGKTKLLPELRARMPPAYKRYIEPFMGGGALFFALEPSDAVLNDASSALVDTYRAVAQAPSDVIDTLKEHVAGHAKDTYYYDVRKLFNNGMWENDAVGHAAAFIYLNKTCFNGLWRVNKQGRFNVPKGAYKNPKILDTEAIYAAARVLKNATLLDEGYGNVTGSYAQSGDFCYMDPPYDPVSVTSDFTAYTSEPFGREQQRLLAEHAHMLANRGVLVMLSNNDTKYVRSLYEGFYIDVVKCGRSINSKGDKRGEVDEVIITSYLGPN